MHWWVTIVQWGRGALGSWQDGTSCETAVRALCFHLFCRRVPARSAQQQLGRLATWDGGEQSPCGFMPARPRPARQSQSPGHEAPRCGRSRCCRACRAGGAGQKGGGGHAWCKGRRSKWVIERLLQPGGSPPARGRCWRQEQQKAHVDSARQAFSAHVPTPSTSCNPRHPAAHPAAVPRGPRDSRLMTRCTLLRGGRRSLRSPSAGGAASPARRPGVEKLKWYLTALRRVSRSALHTCGAEAAATREAWQAAMAGAHAAFRRCLDHKRMHAAGCAC